MVLMKLDFVSLVWSGNTLGKFIRWLRGSLLKIWILPSLSFENKMRILQFTKSLMANLLRSFEPTYYLNNRLINNEIFSSFLGSPLVHVRCIEHDCIEQCTLHTTL